MVKRKKPAVSEKDDDSLFLDPSSRGLIYDEIDDFHDKDEFVMQEDLSDDDDNDDEEQVLGLDGLDSDKSDSSDEEEEEDGNNDDLMENDIHSPNQSDADDQNDERALGNKKKYFFGTDLTDQRIHNASRFRNQKRGNAALELEIQGAKQLQERMRKEMGLGLFSEQLFSNATQKEEETLPDKIREIKIKGDSPQSKGLKKLKKTSKKLPMLADFQEKVDELALRLSPLMEAKKKGLLPSSPAVEYLQARYILSLNYLNILSAYMMVKSSAEDTSQHPIEARLMQYKHLFVELESCQSKYDPQLTSLLSDVNSGKLAAKRPKERRKLLKATQAMKRSRTLSPSDSDAEEMEVEQGKGKGVPQSDDSDSEGENESEVVETGPVMTVNDQTRRLITKKISKNKGLLPSRKKEQRNPRVKYKKKYQQKLKRRKGQVREVRREIDRYAGEISGINPHVIKSRKLK